MPEFLTTKELAALLRIKERKVYDLAASGAVPCSKALGKLLFPRDAIDAWLLENGSSFGHRAPAQAPDVFLGSHDPLLEWALRESRCGLATYFDGSSDGLARFAACEGIATGLHLYDETGGSWNTSSVRQNCASMPVVLVEWAKRRRGLIVRGGLRDAIHTISNLKNRHVVPRQDEAGAQKLFLHLLSTADMTPDDLTFAAPARTELDASLAILEDKADAAFGLQAFASQYKLPFIPVLEERFDILVDRRAWFEPPMQKLLTFCQSRTFRLRAADLDGYDVSNAGHVHYNGP